MILEQPEDTMYVVELMTENRFFKPIEEYRGVPMTRMTGNFMGAEAFNTPFSATQFMLRLHKEHNIRLQDMRIRPVHLKWQVSFARGMS